MKYAVGGLGRACYSASCQERLLPKPADKTEWAYIWVATRGRNEAKIFHFVVLIP
jgi:hypothetical protein